MIYEVHYYRYGYEQEPKRFSTLNEAADWAYRGSVEHTYYVEWALNTVDRQIYRRHELLELGEKRAAKNR